MRRPLETIFKEDVQKILDHFCACFNIRILFYSPAGEMLRVGLNRPDSEYCRLVRDRLYGVSTCLELDESKRQEAAIKRAMICYVCHGGLTEAIKPIYFEEKLLGFAAIGQFRSTEQAPVQVAKDWCLLRNVHEIESAYSSLPYVRQDRIDDILGLFSVMVDYVVVQRMVMLKGNTVLQEVIAYIESHVDQDITLAQVAEHVHKSSSTVSHLFKKKLGKSFKHSLIETKLRKAEEHMTADPEITVGEAAAKVGYADPLHFSRIYKRYRGVPPSEFVKRHIVQTESN
jgi:AraC-like DNA-binding protein/ligand-binding sensor protein